jgi:glucose-1-phosphate adenylyltransferase
VLAGQVQNSIFGGGSLIDGATLHNCVVRREVVVEEDAVLDDCVVMDYVRVGKGARLRRTIVDGYNRIPPGTVIGEDPEEDRRRYHVSASGIVVVPMGRVGRFARAGAEGYL